MASENKNLVIGVDYGTDSVRAIVIDATNGAEIASELFHYPRWQEGRYCDPRQNQFRQHPLDYLEGLVASINGAIAKAPAGTAERIRGISVDTTGSTPCAVDQKGAPLALTPGFEENPNAMFILWKDHTAIKDAVEINALAQSWGGEDFTKYSGGVYSSEWFWSKILHVLRADKKMRGAAYSWVEHCDWIPALLTGHTDPVTMKRSRTAAGHKAMWHASWKGLPLEEFLIKLDPLLAGLRDRLYATTYTGDVPAGRLAEEWAKRLGLPAEVVIGVGSIDAHAGAIGAEIAPHTLVKVMGTSTCDMIITAIPKTGEHLVRGICGQVDGSIIPGMLGMEAGQSAFGDIYAWFRQLLLWPVEHFLKQAASVEEHTRNKMLEEIAQAVLPELAKEAEKLPIDESGILAVDWMNGRRTPDANQTLKGALTGLNLASDAPRIFRALVEATAFGAKKIVDRFKDEGVQIDGVIAIGGIPKKSPFVMQVTADVLNMPIRVAAAEQACALGSAMAAAVASGIYATMPEAQKKMGGGFKKVYEPNPNSAEKYRRIYEKYSKLCDVIENDM